MALLLVEGFDHELNTGDLTSILTVTNSNLVMSGSSPRWGTGKYIQLVGGTLQPANAIMLLPGAFSSGFAGVALRLEGGATTSWIGMGFYDINGGMQMSILISNNGQGAVNVYRGNFTTLLYQVTGVFNTAQLWHYVELGGVISATVGTCIVQIDGVQVLSLTGLNNKGASASTFSHLWLGTLVSQQICDYDDVYFCDNTGPAPQNTFLGDCRVQSLFGTSDDSVQFAPNSGVNNFSRISETAMDSDTSYNFSNTVGSQDTFNHPAISGTPVTIFGLQLTTSARKDDTAAHTFKNVLKSGATTALGNNYTVGSNYSYYKDIWTLDPNTSTAWTNTSINATKNGYNLVS